MMHRMRSHAGAPHAAFWESNEHLKIDLAKVLYIFKTFINVFLKSPSIHLSSVKCVLGAGRGIFIIINIRFMSLCLQISTQNK